MKRALIDTDILSYYLKGKESVIKNFKKYTQYFDLIEISIITYYEIVSGLLAKKAIKQLSIFDEFIDYNLVLPVTEKSARISSELYSTLQQSGKTVDDIDLLIAGIAIEHDMILVTNNEKHFTKIPELEIQNWIKHVL